MHDDVHKFLIILVILLLSQVSLLCHGALMIVHSCLPAPKTIEQYAGILLVERYTMNIRTFERVICALFAYLLFLFLCSYGAHLPFFCYRLLVSYRQVLMETLTFTGIERFQVS
jgi:hypothetical protein